MKQIDLLFNIIELNNIYKDSADLQTILDRTVHAIADFMKSTICSIYCFDERSGDLTMLANVGFDPGAVESVKIKMTEGLAGLALRESRAIYEKKGSMNPNYKRVPGLDEEKYDTYLVLPIEKGITKIGVLMLQREIGKTFSASEIKVSKIIASHLAIMIDNDRLMSYIGGRYKAGSHKAVKNGVDISYNFIKGKTASEGYHYSEIYKISQTDPFEFFTKSRFNKKYTKEEFISSLKLTESEIAELQKIIEKDFSEAASLIFGAHLLILRDRNFSGEILKLIDNGENPPTALIKIATNYIKLLLNSPSDYIKEKAKDIEDIAKRILNNLVKNDSRMPGVMNKIIVANELLLSDLIRLYSEKAGGIILLTGGATSHFSILARTLNIPVMIVEDPRILELPDSTMILMDAEAGNIYINPHKEIVDQFNIRNKARMDLRRENLKPRQKTVTKDGVAVRLMININLLSDLKTAEKMPYEGVGLYRTEMPFLVRKDFPDEEEQYKIYKILLDRAKGREVTFRTLDIGGDKVLPYNNSPKEQNPFLGLRSIRFSLKQTDIFKQQLRAILRAGHMMNIKIMFPMISSIEEFITAKNIVLECSDFLESKKIPYNKNPEIGMMIELPSVVEMMDDFCSISDFFSIGTNDLIQYILAVDRTNDDVADMYIAHHPAVLRALKKIIKTSISRGIDISICGDMANKKEYLAFLIGSGIRKISVEPANFPRVQDFISRIDTKKAARQVNEVLKKSTIKDIEEILKIT